MRASASSGLMVKPMPRTMEPWNDLSAFADRRCLRHPVGDFRHNISSIPATGSPSRRHSPPHVWEVAQTLDISTVASPGQVVEEMARWIVHPVVDDLREADLAGVALRDGVGGQEPDGSGESGGFQEEVRHQVGRPLLPAGDPGDEVVAVVRPGGARDLLAAHKGRVTQEHVESGRTWPGEDLGKRDRPVEWIP